MNEVFHLKSFSTNFVVQPGMLQEMGIIKHVKMVARVMLRCVSCVEFHASCVHCLQLRWFCPKSSLLQCQSAVAYNAYIAMHWFHCYQSKTNKSENRDDLCDAPMTSWYSFTWRSERKIQKRNDLWATLTIWQFDSAKKLQNVRFIWKRHFMGVCKKVFLANNFWI